MQSLTRMVESYRAYSMWAVTGCLLVSLVLLIFVMPIRADDAQTSGALRLPAGEVLDHYNSQLETPANMTEQSAGSSTAPLLQLAKPKSRLPESDASSSSTQDDAFHRGASAVPVDVGAHEEDLVQRRTAPLGLEHRQQEGQTLKRVQTGTDSRFWDVLPLAAVLALIAGLAIVVKRCMPARRLLTGAGVVDIVTRTPLSPKQSLVLIKMGRKLVLLGVCPERISALTTVEDADQVAALMGEAASRRPGSISSEFSETFNQEAGAYVDQIDEDVDLSAETGGHVRGLLEKVRRFAQNRDVA